MADRGEPKLTDEARAYVVCALAAFDPPGIVAANVKKEFGLIVSAQGCEAYDPTKRAGAKLSERWKQMFEKARRAFIEDTSTIPISHRSTRLRALSRMAATAEEKGNFALAAQLHEQAAKEVGDSYTNRHRIDGTLMHRQDPREMTDEELAAIAAGGSP